MSKSKTKVTGDSRQYPFDRHSWRFLDYGSREENLIAEVKKETVLYDKKCSAYRKIEATEEAWKRISDVLGISVDSCKKRWKSLRDCFIKHYRAGLISKQHPQTSKKSWPYYDRLSFLSKHVQLYRVGDYEYCKSEDDQASQDDIAPDGAPGADNGLQTDEASSDAIFEEGHAEYIQIEECDETRADTPRSERTEYQHAGNTHSKALSTRSAVSYMPGEQHQHGPPGGSITNSDERFLLSCAPALQRLPKRKNALVRLKIQQLLYEMEFGDEDERANEMDEKKKQIRLGQ